MAWTWCKVDQMMWIMTNTSSSSCSRYSNSNNSSNSNSNRRIILGKEEVNLVLATRRAYCLDHTTKWELRVTSSDPSQSTRPRVVITQTLSGRLMERLVRSETFQMASLTLTTRSLAQLSRQESRLARRVTSRFQMVVSIRRRTSSHLLIASRQRTWWVQVMTHFKRWICVINSVQ